MSKTDVPGLVSGETSHSGWQSATFSLGPQNMAFPLCSCGERKVWVWLWGLLHPWTNEALKLKQSRGKRKEKQKIPGTWEAEHDTPNIDHHSLLLLQMTPLYFSAFLVAQTVNNPPTIQETWVQSWVGKIPLRRAWQSTPVILPGESAHTEEPGSYSPWGCKSWTRLSD